MRIAQVAPLAEAVPPKLYGGTERVVSSLTEELVAQGHEVTLFASGDSETSAKLVPCVPQGLRLAGIRQSGFKIRPIILARANGFASQRAIMRCTGKSFGCCVANGVTASSWWSKVRTASDAGCR